MKLDKNKECSLRGPDSLSLEVAVEGATTTDSSQGTSFKRKDKNRD